MSMSPGRRHRLARLALVVMLALVLLVPAGDQAALAQSTGWSATFDGRPSSPRPFNPSSWDVLVHSRDNGSWKQLPPMAAHHGTNCAGAPASHQVTEYPRAVFQCNDHVMTAINGAGYGLIVLTPNQLVDFAGGETVVTFDMSTFRSAPRDWVSIWLSPFDDHVPLPLADWLPDLTGEPRRAVQIDMGNFNGQTIFGASVIREFNVQTLDSNWWTGYEQFLTTSAVRRDTFELRISRTSLKFGMPAYDHWWVDTTFADLGWDRAVLQLAHHSYTPEKDCAPGACGPNTWHWDNVSISRAVPFQMVKGDLPWVDATGRTSVNFSSGAPPRSFLRFMGIGSNLQVSFDGGQSWQAASMQQVRKAKDEAFRPYWMPIPPGTTRVDFRGSSFWGGDWFVRDPVIWSQSLESAPPPPPAPPSGCSPRPQATVQTQVIGGGRLQVTLGAGRPSTASNNLIRRVRVVRADNAQVSVLGQTFGANGGTVTLSPASPSVTLTVTRQPAGAPVAVTVPLIVTDDCGEWQTFVGGGATAF